MLIMKLKKTWLNLIGLSTAMFSRVLISGLVLFTYALNAKGLGELQILNYALRFLFWRLSLAFPILSDHLGYLNKHPSQALLEW